MSSPYPVEAVPLGFDTDLANCKGADTNMFFPTGRSADPRTNKEQQQAIDICTSCPVIDPCLEYAVKNEPTGIWGGKTEVQREMIRREKGIALPLGRSLSPFINNMKRVERAKRQRNREKESAPQSNTLAE